MATTGVVIQLTVLIRAILTQLHDHFVGAGVQRVEVLPLFLLHAVERVRLDAPHASLEISARSKKESSMWP